MRADYKCKNKECQKVIEFVKEHGANFPETIECDECKSPMTRVWTKSIISISEGMVNGMYKGTRFTPKKNLHAHRTFQADYYKN